MLAILVILTFVSTDSAGENLLFTEPYTVYENQTQNLTLNSTQRKLLKLSVTKPIFIKLLIEQPFDRNETQQVIGQFPSQKSKVSVEETEIDTKPIYYSAGLCIIVISFVVAFLYAYYSKAMNQKQSFCYRVTEKV